MAIEALSQLHTESIETPKIAGYSLRKISITSALQVPASDIGIDTVLSMQPVHWSNARALPQWWQFAISSAVPDSDSWTEHCTGQIRVETTQGEIRPLAESSVHLRQNKMDAWYERFAELGILYGPTFRGLSKLKAHYREKKAMADVVLEPTKHTFAGESEYVIHPATLDMCLQLGLVASYSGQVEDVQHVYVPIAVENMSIWLQKSAGGPSRMGQAIAVSNNRGIRSVCSDIQLFNESGAPMVQIGNLRCTLYDGVPNQQVVTSYPRDPYCRLRWKPDIEDLSNEQARRIFQPVILMEAVGPFMARAELLATYLIIQVAELQDKIAHGTIPDHLQTFLKWVKRSFAKICSRGLLGSSEALLESFAHRSQIIDSLSKEMNDHVEVRLVKRLYDDLPAILANETSSLQVALQDNLLTTIYETGFISYAYPQFLRVLDLLAHKNPRMKIIEIGAGTGGATRIAMQALSSGASSKLYKNYTFTDITASFFAHAQEEFSESKGMTFKKLDIGDDPFKQGFSSDYELAIASQSLHTTPTLANTVQNVRKLLRPGGKLLLLEITRELNLIGLIFGTFPDYWNGAEDGRIDSPFISKEQWSELLINNGFSGIDIVLDDLPELASTVSTILATAVEPIISPQAAEPSLRPSVFVVYTKELPLFATSIARVLHAGGIDGVCVPLSDARLLQSSRVISIVDLHNSPLSGADQAEFEGARDLVLRAATLVWVSAGGLMNACRPTAALIQGLMATVAIERPSTRYATIDLDPCFDQQAEHVAQTIIQKEASLNGKPSTASMDTEYIMSDGCLQMSRMIPDRTLNDHFRLREGYSKHTEMLLVGSLEPVKLEFEQPGILKSIYYKSDKEYLQPLHHDYVEVKLMAATLSRSVCQELRGSI